MLTGEIQCALAVFEGLFPPPHDESIHELLFELAMWHGFAKLRLHTESSICTLEVSTMRLAMIFGTLSQSPVKHLIRESCLLRRPLEAGGQQHWQINRGFLRAM